MVCRKSVWGPAAWKFMHCAAESATTEEDGDTLTAEASQNLRRLVEAVSVALPCPVCRTHFAQQLATAERRHQSGLWSSRETARRFLIDAHNEVNRQQGKTVVRADDVPDILNAPRGADGQWKTPAVVGVIAVSVIILIIALVALFT